MLPETTGRSQRHATTLRVSRIADHTLEPLSPRRGTTIPGGPLATKDARSVVCQVPKRLLGGQGGPLILELSEDTFKHLVIRPLRWVSRLQAFTTSVSMLGRLSGRPAGTALSSLPSSQPRMRTRLRLSRPSAPAAPAPVPT